jgi:hypothetical protein
MPKYTPIDTTPRIRSSLSDVLEFRWTENHRVAADFTIPGDQKHALRVCFEKAEIVRIVDEMPISTESEQSAHEGLIPDHLAYAVDGASFWLTQSDALKIARPLLRHYRFITGWTCIDVVSENTPTFLVIPRLQAAPN